MIEVIRNILRYTKLRIVLCTLASLFSGVCNVLLLVEITRGISSGVQLTTGYILQFAALVLVTFITGVGSQMLSAHLVGSFAMKIRLQICRAIVESPLRTVERVGKHRLIASFAQDAGSVAQAAMQLPNCCMHVTIILCCMAYLSYISIPIFISVLILVPLAVFSYRVPESIAMRYSTLEREKWDEMVGQFHSLTDGIKELKLNRWRRIQFFTRQLHQTSRISLHYGKIAANIYVSIITWSNMLYFVVIGMIMILLPRFISVSREALVACALVVLYLRVPLAGLLETFREFNRASVALRKFRQLGLPWDHVFAALEPEPMPERSWRKIELVDVTHTYYSESESDDRPFVLGPINLTLTPGRLVFVAGGNGSGKTTLAKLITGLYFPESGTVRLDGVAVDEKNRDDYRQYFSAVFSEFALFEDLLEEADSSQLKFDADRYLRLLHLEQKVKVLDGNLSTIQLSSGQRRRLALLHAYLEDRPLYLFDEWAADQDPTFKEIFYNSLLPDLRAKNKTVIVISHDDRYYTVANEIIRLDNGKIVSVDDVQKTDADQFRTRYWQTPTGEVVS
jgi:putative ATP-binding cassette transporter